MGGSTIVAKRERNLKFIPRVSSCSVGHTSVCLRLRYLQSDPCLASERASTGQPPARSPPACGPTIGGSSTADPGLRLRIHRRARRDRVIGGFSTTAALLRLRIHRCPRSARSPGRGAPHRPVEAFRRPSRDPAGAAHPQVDAGRERRSRRVKDERPRSRRSSHGVDRGSRGQTPPPRSSPPSAVMVWPVSQAASSESRKPTTPAMSSGSPRRLSGYGAETSSSRPS